MTPAALSTLRRFCHHEFSAEALTSAKQAATVSVCLPARDEAATIGPIVAAIRADLAEKTHLVDEIVVIDDRSTDTTAAAAAASGARVVPVATSSGSQPGKGAAMATAQASGTTAARQGPALETNPRMKPAHPTPGRIGAGA